MPSTTPIPGRCGSRLRGKPGLYCDRYPMQGRTRCRQHGGKTPRGPASPHYINGEHSRLTPDLALKFNDADKDPKLFDLGQDVALTSMWGMELMESLDNAPPLDTKKALVDLQVAMRTQDAEKIGPAFAALEKVVNGNERRFINLKTLVLEVGEQRRKLIDSINRHQVQSAQVVTMTELMALFHGLAQDVLKAIVWLMSQLREDREKAAARKALAMITEDFMKRTRTGDRMLPAPPMATE